MLVQAVTKRPLISNEQSNSHAVHECANLGQFHAILPRTAGSDDRHAPVWLRRAKMSYEAHGCSPWVKSNDVRGIDFCTEWDSADYFIYLNHEESFS